MKKLYPPIRFRFKIDKFIACMGLFAKENFGDFSKLKAAKLLYFADKYHLIRYGRPIIGDTYFHQDNGPIPSKALNIMNEVIGREIPIYAKNESNKEKFEKVLKVKKSMWEKHPIFVANQEPNVDCLSETEQEAIRKTVQKYGKLSPGKLIEKTHEDASWLKTNNNEEIDYRLFFEDDPDADKTALEYMESSREDYELSYGLGFDD